LIKIRRNVSADRQEPQQNYVTFGWLDGSLIYNVTVMVDFLGTVKGPQNKRI